MLGKKIYELRKEFNISQEEFAMAINTSRQSVSKWELGDSYPEVNKLKDIASFFNVSIDYLLDYDIDNTSFKVTALTAFWCCMIYPSLLYTT